MNIEYRILKPTESKKYREIRLECLQNSKENFGSTYEDAVNTPELFFESAIKNEDTYNKIFGAFDGGRLISICGYRRERAVKIMHKVNLVQVYTKPEYRGKKISYELLKFTVEKIFENDEVELITLGVVADNLSAGKLYERLGFKDYGYHKNYFKDELGNRDQRLMILERSQS